MRRQSFLYLNAFMRQSPYRKRRAIVFMADKILSLKALVSSEWRIQRDMRCAGNLSMQSCVRNSTAKTSAVRTMTSVTFTAF